MQITKNYSMPLFDSSQNNKNMEKSPKSFDWQHEARAVQIDCRTVTVQFCINLMLWQRKSRRMKVEEKKVDSTKANVQMLL